MTKLAKALVWVGGGLLTAAVVVLGFNDSAVFESCKTVSNYEREPASPGNGKGSGDEQNPRRPLVEVKRVKTCSPVDLMGDLPLLLAALGGALICPGLLRVVPRGRYQVGPVAADTTPPPEQIEETAVAAAEQYRKINTAVTPPSPDLPPERAPQETEDESPQH